MLQFLCVITAYSYFFFPPKCPKKEFLLRVSYMEIYNETVTDLLVDSWKRKPLEVRETINVSSPRHVLCLPILSGDTSSVHYSQQLSAFFL